MTERVIAVANKYGVPAALALFLTYWMANDVAGTLRKLDRELADHVSETNFYLRAICINAAESEGERANCLYR